MTSQILTQELIKASFFYNQKTGSSVWKNRPISHFQSTEKRNSSHICNNWNSKHANTDVGYECKTNGYTTVSIFNKPYMLHVLNWVYVYGYFPNEIDHKNGERSDNRICNLREVTRSVNSKNKCILKNNTSGVCGVCFDKQCGKWKAQIKNGFKYKNLGVYNNFNDAVIARKMAEYEHGYYKNHGRMSSLLKPK